jgi:hypothetical protein
MTEGHRRTRRAPEDEKWTDDDGPISRRQYLYGTPEEGSRLRGERDQSGTSDTLKETLRVGML